jgi:hypothetical protein
MKMVTPAMVKSSRAGKAAVRYFCATRIPKYMLRVITIHISRHDCASRDGPLVRARFVNVRNNSDVT